MKKLLQRKLGNLRPNMFSDVSVQMRILPACILLLLTSCQSAIYGTADDFAKISLGMTKDEVIGVLGNPVSVSCNADTNEELLIYKRMKHPISAWTRSYEVTFREGKVVRFGEQYEEVNVNNF
jgi:outer membrane protein assembly factor BamE (lipoprotein component of BamABCDE complex)